nr:hypothetical protein [Pleurocapsa sp. PCC 7319]
MIINTACSQGNIAQTGGQAYTETAKRAMSDTYDDYDANQDFKGGMNGYNDDRRYDAETSAKTKALIDRAESRQNDNLGDYVEGISDRVNDKIETAKKAFDEATDTAQDTIEDATQAGKRTAKEIKGNFQDLT